MTKRRILPKSKSKAEFGDFQTPAALANDLCRLLKRKGINPSSIVEPTCGTGNLLIAAHDVFESVDRSVGLEINAKYVAQARARVRGKNSQIVCDDFFGANWSKILRSLTDPLLIVGNPPWVTNADLGSMGSGNLPRKTNFHGYEGIDALTGKSNFDISEWMIIRLLGLVGDREATVAMLCKTAVARKVLTFAWKNLAAIEEACIYRIDANRHFGATVDACFLVCRLNRSRLSYDCACFDSIASSTPTVTIGYKDGQLVADVRAYEKWKHLQGEEVYKWRSGIKHDCSRVMELQKHGPKYRNGFGETVDLEPRFVYPMLKGSDLANGNLIDPRRHMLVPQRSTGEDTGRIRNEAPRTWAYLERHADRLGRRASSIYRNRPRFSIFGIGSYSFAPWKVAIAGMYKRFDFRVVGSSGGCPIVLDDTSYFLACVSKHEAQLLASLLNSSAARDLLGAFVFWDAKRPVTIDLLRRLDLRRLAKALGKASELEVCLEVPRIETENPLVLARAQHVLFA